MAEQQQLRVVMDGPTLDAFLADYSFVTIIRGPWASGKSVACIVKLYQIAHQQLPNRQGVRKTRWAVIRNSYPDLQETTIKSWLDWFPEAVYGPLRRSRPFQHVVRVQGAPYQGRPTTVEIEVLFLALDEDDDRKKLLSMELTGAWVNEARELDKPIIDDVIGRTGRYPPKRDGGHSWSGVLMDTNAPSENHWLPIMMGESPVPESMSEEEKASLIRPENWTYYVQPGALVELKDDTGKITGYGPNPLAENIRNLTDAFQYYLQRIGGKTRSWIRVNFCNKLGQMLAGKPVWPTFAREKHVARETLKYDPALLLYVGIDSTGRKPAAIFGQVHRGRWSILGELIGVDVPDDIFAPQVKRKVGELLASAGQTFGTGKVVYYRDPHMQRSEHDDTTTDQVYMKHGIRLMPAPVPGNAIETRTSVVELLFDNDHILISPVCTMLIAGCEGGYHYRKLKLSGQEVYEDTPNKRSPYADPADALQYLVLGGGEGRTMAGMAARPKPVHTVTAYRPGMHRDRPVRRHA